MSKKGSAAGTAATTRLTIEEFHDLTTGEGTVLHRKLGFTEEVWEYDYVKTPRKKTDSASAATSGNILNTSTLISGEIAESEKSVFDMIKDKIHNQEENPVILSSNSLYLSKNYAKMFRAYSDIPDITQHEIAVLSSFESYFKHHLAHAEKELKSNPKKSPAECFSKLEAVLKIQMLRFAYDTEVNLEIMSYIESRNPQAIRKYANQMLSTNTGDIDKESTSASYRNFMVNEIQEFAEHISNKGGELPDTTNPEEQIRKLNKIILQQQGKIKELQKKTDISALEEFSERKKYIPKKKAKEPEEEESEKESEKGSASDDNESEESHTNSEDEESDDD